MEKNKVIKDIFTDEQIVKLKYIIALNMHKMVLNNDPNRGRDDLELYEKSNNDIFDKNIIDTVLSHFDEGYYVQHITFSDYNNNHINPNLPLHKDPNYPDNGLTFDYQLESNVDWPFYIDDEGFTMKDNEAIIFDPKNSWHYRPDQTFKDGEYVRIVFFYLNKN